MKTQKLTITEYAKLRGISRQAVLKSIKENRALPNVTKFEKIGKYYVLTVKTQI